MNKKNILEFFNILYGNTPPNGFLVIWTKQNKASHFFNVTEFDQAAEEACRLSQDYDVYYGVGLQGSQPEKGRGTADTVVSIPGVWLDIDILVPYNSSKNKKLPPNWEAVNTWLKSLKLEPTLVISTGGGYHVYWLFNEPMVFKTAEERKGAWDLSVRFQSTLRQLAVREGWKLDNTSDLSRILRPLGTFNHKSGSRVQVELIDSQPNARYSSKEISEFLDRVASTMEPNGQKDAAENPNQGQQNQNKRKQQSSLIVDLFNGIELFHTPEGEGYAVIPLNGHKEIMPLRSSEIKNYIFKEYRQKNDSVPGQQAVQNAINVLEGIAVWDKRKCQVHVRLAYENGAIYLDLADDKRQFVRVASDGWEILGDSPVYFRRVPGMNPLPSPEIDGSISQLKEFINFDSEEQWILMVAFLMSALSAKGPYPILILEGEQGSAKSTTAKIFKDLIDPATSPLRSLTNNQTDFIIAAKNNWVIVFDNLSGISREISDMLCRLSTGGGLSKRALYTDADEIVIDVQRPAILNGIDNVVSRSDLADRAIIVSLPRIPDAKRKLESELWESFQKVKPKILGALLDAVSHALRNLSNVSLKSLPRMADFARWVVAAEEKLSWGPGKFIKAYERNRNESMLDVLEADAFAATLRDFLMSKRKFEGTTSELLKELESFSGEDHRKDKAWPKSPNQASKKINLIAPALRKNGMSVDHKRKNGKKIWVLTFDEENVDYRDLPN